jgi:N-acetylglucosamine kinase-like BadF-type ATPase
MILLADGGSTKTDWRLVDNGGEVACTRTQGANPLFRTPDDLQAEWKAAPVALSGGRTIEAIHFYGAGCCSEDTKDSLRTALSHCWPHTPLIEVESDLLGAARGLAGHQPAIVCILGTGSNSCEYDGCGIGTHIPPLGYLLGDEGSGADLGKRLAGACLRGRLTPELTALFFNYSGLTAETFLHKVYHHPAPNRFLAALAPFLLPHMEDATLHALVLDAFRDFLTKTVLHYRYACLPLHFTGSIAFHYRAVLREAAQGLHISIASICPSPMEGLIRYHSAPR